MAIGREYSAQILPPQAEEKSMFGEKSPAVSGMMNEGVVLKVHFEVFVFPACADKVPKKIKVPASTKIARFINCSKNALKYTIILEFFKNFGNHFPISAYRKQ